MPEPPPLSPDPSVAQAKGPLRWGAIALGAALDIAATRLCVTAVSIGAGVFAAVLWPSTPADPGAAQAAMQSAMTGPRLHVVLTVVGLLCSVAGGALTAYMAKSKILLNTAVMGTCSGIVGLLMTGLPSEQSLTASHLALTATTIPAAMAGGLLYRLLGQRR
jgi:hypothetical protein